MKKALVLLVAVALLSGIAASGTKEFYKGSFTLTPQVGLNRFAIPFGSERGVWPDAQHQPGSDGHGLDVER